jgi:hypothetical protein
MKLGIIIMLVEIIRFVLLNARFHVTAYNKIAMLLREIMSMDALVLLLLLYWSCNLVWVLTSSIGLWRFSNSKFVWGEGRQPHAQPPSRRTRDSTSFGLYPL